MARNRQNLNIIYISDRMRETLRPIASCALTAVVAPMGYGKTTAVRWFLAEQAKAGAVVLQASIYSDNRSIFWKSVQKAFAAAGLTVLEGYDCPADASGAALLLEDLCAALGGKTPYYLFLDDFHLLGDERVRVHPYGALTVGEQGETLADLAGLAPHVVAFSDDGRGVQSESMMRQAMLEAKRLGKVVAAHCEDNRLLRGGYIHDGVYARLHGHRGICSESEWGQIARDVKLAGETGCAYHVCHVSTKKSVEVIRAAKRRGVNVTCETAPHYLAFTQDDLQEDGRFKMNPPLRDQADQDALIEGLLDGTIDMLVTDHAPHSHEEKSKGLEKSAMGVVGLETSFAASYTHLVKKGILPLEKLVELMHTSPMRRFGCGTEIAVGQPADLTVFDLNGTYTVDPETFLTMGRATPFAGTCLTGACKLTMIGGEIVWKEDML